MKVLMLVALISLPAFASAFPKVLEVGIYKGFGPTDQSAAALGEVQIDVMTERMAHIRYATGSEVRETHIDLSQLVPLPEEDVRAIGLTNVRAFRPLGKTYPVIVLNHSLPYGRLARIPGFARALINRAFGTASVTIYTGTMTDMMMPIFLFSPAQVVAGRFDKFLANLEKDLGQGIVPRVGLGGRALDDVTCSLLLHTTGTLNPAKGLD